MKRALNERVPELLKLFMCLGITLCLRWKGGDQMMMLVAKSEQLPDALTGILTFSSLILGFIGVLLPAIMGMKKESDLVESFFKRVPPKRFSMFVRSNILSGLLLTICAVTMFFVKDIMDNNFKQVAMLAGWATLFFSIYFTVTTFCVLNLLLRLLLEDKNSEAYPKG